MAPYLNIVERTLRNAEEHPDRIALILPGQQISYASFRQLILAYAQHARNHGIGRDSIVAIDFDDILTSYAAVLACTLLAAPWVVATAPIIVGRKLPYTHLLYGGAKKHEPSHTHLRVDARWSTAPPGASTTFENAGPDDVWMYSQSSGTTGTPKFMAKTHRLNEESFNRGFSIPDGWQVVAGFLAPPGSGVSNYMIRVFSLGGTVVAGSNLDYFLRFGVNRVSGSPIQFAKLIDKKSKPASKIYAGIVTGAAAPETLLVRMLDFFERVYIWYGSSELGIANEHIVDSLPVDPSNVGKVMPNYEVMVVDSDDRAVPTGAEGIVRMRRTDSRQVTGYVGAEDATKAIFRDGWFYPGDIGRFSENGELHIVGRSDDRLNVGGVKLDASRVDAVIQNTPQVRDGYCFEDRDEVGRSRLSLLLSLDDGAKPGEVVREIYRTMGEQRLFYRVYRACVTDDPPRTMTGKPIRRFAPEYLRKQKTFELKLHQPGT